MASVGIDEEGAGLTTVDTGRRLRGGRRERSSLELAGRWEKRGQEGEKHG